MGEAEEEVYKPHKAAIEDDYLRHPFTNSLVRNPLKVGPKDGVLEPVVWSAAEFSHNCLEEAMNTWNLIRVNEGSLGAMTSEASSPVPSPRISPRAPRRVMLGALQHLDRSYEFKVLLDKTCNLDRPDKNSRKKQKVTIGQMIVDKLLIDVRIVDVGSSHQAIRIEAVQPNGIVALVWNRQNPLFEVLPGDDIICVNNKRHDAEDMMSELNESDVLNITIKRSKGVVVSQQLKLPKADGATNPRTLTKGAVSRGLSKEKTTALPKITSDGGRGKVALNGNDRPPSKTPRQLS